MKTSNALIWGMVGQAIGIGVGLLITEYGMPYGPHIGGFAALVLIGLILAKALKELRLSQVLLLLPIWALVYVLILQTLGFMWFPGLVKDLDPFSKEHLRNAVLIFGLVLIVYAGELAVLKLVFGRRGQA